MAATDSAPTALEKFFQLILRHDAPVGVPVDDMSAFENPSAPALNILGGFLSYDPVNRQNVLSVGSILGTMAVGTATYREDGTDWAVIPAGGTGAAYTLPLPHLGLGEQVTIAVSVDLQANIAIPPTVTAATGNGAPVVLTLSSVVGLATGDRAFVSGVTGNVGANGGAYYSVSGSTIHLFSDAALTVPIVGTGTYVAGGVVLSLGFGHAERRATFRECGGVIVNTLFTGTDVDITSPSPPFNVTPSLIGTLVQLVPQGGAIVVKVTAPAGVPLRAAPSVSFVRRPVPGAGPIPIVTSTSLSSGSGSGGTVTVLTGAHFTGAVQVTLAGIPASFVVDSDTQITATSSPDPLGGTGDIAVTTGNGTGVMGNPTAWTYTVDPSSIFGSTLRAYWESDTTNHSGAVVTSIPDKSGNGQTMTVVSGSTGWVYAATDASWNNAPSWGSVSASTTEMEVASFNMGAADAAIFVWALVKDTTPGAGGQGVIDWAVSGGFQLRWTGTGGTPEMLGANGVLATYGSGSTAAHQLTGFSDGNLNPSVNWVNVDGGTKVQNTNTLALATPSSGRMVFGTRLLGGAGIMNGTIVAMGVVALPKGTQPTAPQLAALHSYHQTKYGVP